MSSIRVNVIFNYIGQFYIAFVGILVLPFFLKYLGAEEYGLIGFYTLLQSWIQLLDLGLSPTLGREVARLRFDAARAYQLRTVVRSLEIIFFVMAILSVLILLMSREWFVNEWLNIVKLDLVVAANCIGLMACIIGVRWLASLYRSGINAYEKQVWMNVVDIIFVTLRFPGALVLIAFFGGDLLSYFCYQLLISFIELLVIRYKLYQLLPSVSENIQFSFPEVKRIAPFALSIAYTGVVWVFITQLDKLFLSKILSLSEYGYFTLVATICSGLVLLSSPINKAILPRMTVLVNDNKYDQAHGLYKRATRLLVSISMPVVFVIVCFPAEVVYVWTGNEEATRWAAQVMPIFVLGNGILVLASFQYYLQYAYGQLRYHVIYNTVVAIVSVPAIIYAAFQYGVLGVGWVWLVFRFVSFMVWTPFVHNKLAPGLQKGWLFVDVLPGVVISGFFVLMVRYLGIIGIDKSRLQLFTILALITISTAAITLMFSMLDKIKRPAFE